LIHFPVLNIFTYFNLFQYPASSLIYVVLSIGLSVLSFYYLETPTRKWLLNRFNPRSGKTMLVESGAR
jgi:peptidoglycan/LPS O-acetylase OafA/YrhL